MNARQLTWAWWGVLFAGAAVAVEPAATGVPEIRAAEPGGAYSLERATRYLDAAALDWQQTKKCGACHTNYACLMARPAVAALLPAPKAMRGFFEELVEKQWQAKGPRWDAEVVMAAFTLAFHDRQTTGKLHPTSRTALDRMWTVQRADGGFNWLKCGWPPMESDDHYGATIAALAAGVAPGQYARSDAARRGLDNIRKYLAANPAPSLHHQAMLLWTSSYVEGILDPKQRQSVLDELFARQLADGGWAVAGLLAEWKDHQRKDKLPQITNAGDGYATGFAVFVARHSGVPASDPRIGRAIAWLKANQKESGRWFTPSPTKDSKHLITNAGTAYAVMALAACGEVPQSTANIPR